MHFIIKKTVCVVLVFFSIFLSSIAVADLYQWQDEKGDIHIVDDILLVPPEYKDKAKSLKSKPFEQGHSSSQPIIQPPKPSEPPAKQKEELYGNHPVEWWKEEFNTKKREIRELEKTTEEEKKFILDFERGRRIYNRLYSAEDAEKYEAYKRSLPDNESQLNKLKSELIELRHKAQIHGVPREVRE
jgi:hypothetical protein